MKEQTIFTYVMPRIFNGYNIPISIQSVYLRDYAEKRGFQFKLPVTELVTKNNYFMLSKLSKEKTINHIAMTSVFMLPINNKNFCEKLTNKFSKKCIFHFVLENLEYDKIDLLLCIKEFNKTNKLTNNYNLLKKINLR